MLKKIRYFIQKKFPILYKHIWRIYDKIKKINDREKKRSYGELNRDKQIYVIRIRKQNLGLMGYYMSILGHVRFAVSKGWIPVVDMMNYKNTYLKDDEVGKINSWEYYFEQPGKVSVEEAYRSKKVILSSLESPIEADSRLFYLQKYKDSTVMKGYYDVINKNMRFNNKTQLLLSRAYDSILKPIHEGGVIGVVSRGTDLLGFPGHSVQPSTTELLDNTEVLMKKYNCSYIFLASDTDRAVQEFRNKFGDEYVLVNSCKRYDSFEGNGKNVLSEAHFERENDEYLKGMEYLTTVWLLSKTDVLFGSLVGATVGALCMNEGKYKHIEIYDKGVY